MSDRPNRSAGSEEAGGELVEVLGPGGSVIDIVTRRTMRAETLAHRSTYVVTVLTEAPGPFTVDGDGTAGNSLSDETERWLAGLAWPLIGPDGAINPTPAPDRLRPPADLSPRTPVVVHLRAAWKDVHPGYWDLAFGGVCSVGERWLESAQRELAEESGLVVAPATIRPLAAGHYFDEGNDVFGAVFVAFATALPQPVDEEVVSTEAVALGDLDAWIRDRPVCPDSVALVEPSLALLVGRSPDHG